MRKLALLSIVVAGCAGPSGAGPSKAQVDLRTIKAAGAPWDTGGVAMRAGMITWDSARRYPQVMATLHWLESNDAMPMHMYQGSVGPPGERWGDLPVVPIPTVVLGVLNHSGHPLTLDPARFHLADDRGQVYELYRDRGDVEGRVESDINGMYAGLLSSPAVVDGLRQKVAALPLFVAPVELADGAQALLLLVFKLPLHNPLEYDAYFGQVARLSLRVDGIPGELGFERASARLDVTCPDGATQPSLDRCKPGNMFPRAGKQGGD